MRRNVLVVFVAFMLLSLVGVLNAASLPQTGTWVPAGSMSQVRSGAAVVALPNGAVLITGGSDENGIVLSSTEIFSSDGTFKSVAPMSVARIGHTATWIPQSPGSSSGFVLVAGGTSTDGVIVSSAELYDPAANTWTLLNSLMLETRTGHTATLLPNSSVLLAGGENPSGALASMEVFDLASQQFTFAGAMSSARKAHAAAALRDGRVLIAGGADSQGNTLASTAIYDANTHGLVAGPSLITARANATATTLLDGTVLIAGGNFPEGAVANANVVELNSAEIFDPFAGTITPAQAKLAQPRASHLAFLLPNNNNVLIVGGTYGGAGLASTELYTPWTGAFTQTAPMASARSNATGAPLFPMVDGTLMVAGGSNQRSAELYGFATLKTDADDYAPGTAVMMTGSGWIPGETVTLSLHEISPNDDAPTLTTVADENGNILDGVWAPDINDIGVRFYLTAIGAASQAQVTFTDASPKLNVTVIGPAGSGTVSSADGHITSCAAAPSPGTTCSFTYSANFSTTLTATATGATFTGWSGGCSGTGTCSASANGNNTFSATATFAGTTTTFLASSLNPSVYGQSVTFTATVAPSVATGTVTFKDGVTTLGTGTLTGGVATYTTSSLSVSGSPHSITAVYGGDTSYATSTSSAISQVVNKKPLTITGIGASSKTYDGTPTATLTGTPGTLQGVVGSDVVSLAGAAAGAFADKNAGTNRSVTVSGQSLAGANAGNYTLTEPTTSASITPRAITVTATTNSKAYDGSTSSSASPTITTGSLVGGDTASWSQTFNNKNAGTGKTLTPAGTVTDGNSGNNYAVTFANSSTGTVTARAITVTAATNNKAYDGATSAAAVPTITVGSLASGDTSNFSETYASKNVGTGLTLVPAGSVTDGNSGNNYAVTFANSSTGTITARAITVTAGTDTKAYDGTASSTGTPTLTAGSLIAGDSGTWSQTFNNKNAGTNKTLTPAGTVTDGNSGNNYAVTFANNTTGVITARAITVTATTDTKAYDGTVSSTGTPTLTTGSLLAGDTASWSQTFNNKNAGTGKTLTPAGTVTDGNNGNNYSVTFANGTGTITARAITVTAATNSKGYDGATSAAAVPTITVGSLASGDTSNFSETYASKNVGTGLTLVPAGSVTDGNSGNNYAVTFANNTTGVITARAITATAATDTKAYDGTASSTGTPTLTTGSLVAGDSATWSQTFNDKNVGTGKTLTPSGTVSDGNSGNNYAVTFADNLTGTISGRTLTVSATAANRMYDRTVNASVTLSDDRLAGDVLSTSYSGAVFADKNTGVGKTVSVTGIAISGLDAANYVANVTASATATITPATLTVSAVTQNKTYDGTTSASVSLSDNRLIGDLLSINYATAKFDDKNVGNSKPVSVSGLSISGTDAVNYDLSNTTIDSTGSITPAILTITADSKSMAYGNAVPPLTSTPSGFVAGDSASVLSGEPSLITPAAPTSAVGSYPITITSGGLSAANYTFAFVNGSVSVTPAPLTITADNKSMNYGGVAPALTFSASGFVNGDTATNLAAQPALSTTTNAAGSFPITVSGAASPNYTITYVPGTMAVNMATLTITPDNKTMVYGDTLPALTYSVTGFVNGDTIASLSGQQVITTTASPTSPIGNYTITASGASAANYQISYAPGTLTVGKASLKITPDSFTRLFRRANPTLTGVMTGLRNADSITATYATTATQSSPAGNYPITVASVTDGGTGSLNNYVITNMTGTLTITTSPVDFVENGVSVSGTPAAGQPIQITETALNQGGADAGTSSTFLYLSLDGVTKGTSLGSRSAGAVLAGASSTATTTATLPTNLLGSYYIIACADGASAVVESNETNNCTASAAFTVAGADLTQSAVSVVTQNPIAGGPFQISDTVTNQGSGNAGTSYVSFYLSLDGTTKGTTLGSRSTGTIAAGTTSTGTTTVTLPTSLLGTYYVIACADGNSAVMETNETNNCKASTAFTVAGADLAETAVAILTQNPAAGVSLQISDSVLNQGSGNAGTSYVYLYLSLDGTTKGSTLGTRSTGTIAAGATSTGTTTVTLPTNLLGTYYVIACADGNSAVVETNETNNCKTSAAFSVAGADLAESAVTVLTQNPAAGGTLQISDTATNQGSGNAGASSTFLYLSLDGVTKGASLGSRSAGTIAAGAASTGTTTATLSKGLSGTYYVIGCADGGSAVVESNETNNCKTSAAFTIH